MTISIAESNRRPTCGILDLDDIGQARIANAAQGMRDAYAFLKHFCTAHAISRGPIHYIFSQIDTKAANERYGQTVIG